MNLNIRWKSMDRSKSVEDFLTEKLSKVFDFQFVNDDIKVEFVHYPKEKKFKTRLLLQIHRRNSIHSEAYESDILTSINNSISKAISQLRQIKTQIHLNKN